MADRLTPLPWEQMSSLYTGGIGFIAFTVLRAASRNIEWTVYQVIPGEWRIGVGIIGERGLHTVIAVAGDEVSAKATARDLAHIAGHVW